MNSNGKITAPVSAQDPYTCMGVGKRGDYYDVGYICSNAHGRTNRWSKKKPVHIADALVHSSDTWWKGTSGTCGINYTNAKSNNYKDIISKYTADKNNGWDYEPPFGDRGGVVTSPYRLEDFDGYYHYASPPVSGFSVLAKVAQGGTLIGSVMYTPVSTDNPSLTFADIYAPLLEPGNEIGTLDDYYLGVIVTDITGATILGRVAGNGGSQWQVSFSCINLVMGSTYRAYPFLSQVVLGQMESDKAAQYLTLPSCAYSEFKIVSQQEADGVTISLTAHYNYNENHVKVSITWSLKITAIGGRSFDNSVVMIRFTENKPLDPFVQGETRSELGTINSGYETTKTILLQNTSKNYYVYGSFATGKYTTGKIQPMSEVIP